MLLNKDQILSSDDLAFKDVEVEAWGGTVRIRCLTGEERDAFEQSIVDSKGKARNMKNIRARFLSMSIVGEDGQRLFSDAEVEGLGKKSGKAIDKLFDVAQKLSGLTDDDVEEMAGN